MSSYKILTLSGSSNELNPYRSMIYSSWLHSLRYGNEWYTLIDQAAYFSAYKRIIEHLLGKPDAVARLACLSDDLDTCLGWSLVEGEKLHYCYVKEDMRKQGIGASLIPEGVAQITHLTHIGRAIWHTKMPGTKFDPFN